MNTAAQIEQIVGVKPDHGEGKAEQAQCARQRLDGFAVAQGQPTPFLLPEQAGGEPINANRVAHQLLRERQVKRCQQRAGADQGDDQTVRHPGHPQQQGELVDGDHEQKGTAFAAAELAGGDQQCAVSGQAGNELKLAEHGTGGISGLRYP